MKKLNVNWEIALTHLLSRKKLTIIATLGVAIGIGLYIITSSLVVGLNRFSDNMVFKSAPHIRVYDEDKICRPLDTDYGVENLPIIINPKMTNRSKRLLNPNQLVSEIKQMKEVVHVVPSVNTGLFYNSGKSHIDGKTSGINIVEADSLFDIQSTMLEGDMHDLRATLNGILIGSGIAEKLNLKPGDNISVASPTGVNKLMKVVGIFKTGAKDFDNSMSYINLASAQQLMKEPPSFVTDIYVNLTNFNEASQIASRIEQLIGYKAEDWQTANEQRVSGKVMRTVIFYSISIAIILVAAFGIYNILNMTVSQKLNDIAILKATGFSGKDVIRIFVGESLIMGIAGTIAALLMDIGLAHVLAHIYIGGDMGYFPIHFEQMIGIQGVVIGLTVTFIAGFIPAHKAASIDPVEIFRK
ncbi:Lipoprotein-releasing system transmembrane protein LolE [termite gut metagenome]|uniref:Lipoprotein-releasing system transmembrane protein LolE n=1 Tax=termite gut metagenome TaxID=433724 RepID=A0A5J4RK84_9ZZZZ